jgi:hypothetical protein
MHSKDIKLTFVSLVSFVVDAFYIYHDHNPGQARVEVR